jgi:tetratricopeptide (TPR) repeat protein
MTTQNILEYIENPAGLDEKSIFDLTLLAEQYPYFQVGQLLRVKNLNNISPSTVKPVLNYTAAYITDRKILYYLLHPIQEKPEIVTVKTVEKQIKDTIRENISDTLENQKKQAETNATGEIEFTTSFDLRKEYGEGIEFDEYVVRLNTFNNDTFELIVETEEKSVPETKSESIQSPVPKREKLYDPKDDILTIINKGISADKLEDFSFSLGKNKQNSLIDNFLKSNPKITPPSSEESASKDVSEDSIKESDHLITDTLATIYLKQGNYAKAIFAYEKLILKYPEKSTYFAAQIADIKKIIERTK